MPRNAPASSSDLIELAQILASGILRLRKRRLLGGGSGPVPSESSRNSSLEPLEVPSETVLSVRAGLTVPRVPNTRSTKQ